MSNLFGGSVFICDIGYDNLKLCDSVDFEIF
jgi:hypothetical protein